jgi:hypothetical protein
MVKWIETVESIHVHVHASLLSILPQLHPSLSDIDQVFSLSSGGYFMDFQSCRYVMKCRSQVKVALFLEKPKKFYHSEVLVSCQSAVMLIS